MKEEDEEGSWVNPKELTAVRPKPPPGRVMLLPVSSRQNPWRLYPTFQHPTGFSREPRIREGGCWSGSRHRHPRRQGRSLGERELTWFPPGRWGQKPSVKTWKYVCLIVALTLLLLIALLILFLPPVLRKTEQVQEEVTQLKRKVAQGLADARHDRDFIRGEMFRRVKGARVDNESFCQPCPPDWKTFQGPCYFFSTDNLTWTQANESCFQEQAHLVIINSKAEQEFLTAATQVTVWIGLFREDGGIHRWSDGSAPTYSNRDFEELPDNGTHSTCVMMLHHGPWKDFPCELESSVFICEKRQSC